MQNNVMSNFPKKNDMLKKICNILLMLIVFWAAFLICILLLSRESFVELSKTFFSPQVPPLMGSPVLSFLLRKEFIVLPIIVVTGMIIKEFKIKPLRKRILWNLALLTVTAAHFGLLGYLIFRPVFNAAC